MLLYLYYFVFGGIVPIKEMLSDGRWVVGGLVVLFFYLEWFDSLARPKLVAKSYRYLLQKHIH